MVPVICPSHVETEYKTTPEMWTPPLISALNY